MTLITRAINDQLSWITAVINKLGYKLFLGESLRPGNEGMLHGTQSCSEQWLWRYVLHVNGDREWSQRERNRERVSFPNLGHVSHEEQGLKITTLFVKVFPLYWRQTVTLGRDVTESSEWAKAPGITTFITIGGQVISFVTPRTQRIWMLCSKCSLTFREL